MTQISQIVNPINRFTAFIVERDSIRRKRMAGLVWPWTDDEILRTYRFTNVHREDDKVSRHYQKTIRDRYQEDPMVLPGTVLYRWFNRISTCDAFFNEPYLDNQSVFEHYIFEKDFDILLNCLDKIPTPHVTGAFIIQGKQGYTKGRGVLEYFLGWMEIAWRYQWEKWLKYPPYLVDVYRGINSDGLGTFMRGQIVADLKYLPSIRLAPDWWTWAAPGPGSMRGLNVVLERDFNAPWKEEEWLAELTELNTIVTPRLEEMGIGKLHNQDLQNCLCEFSKYTKVMNNWGRPRQVYRHV